MNDATASPYADAVRGSARLHRATVAMAIRHGITLPGLSPGHTIAIAKNLGLLRGKPRAAKSDGAGR